MNGIEWEDPPFSNIVTRNSKWQRVTKELQRYPGQWAKVAVGVSSNAKYYLRRAYGLETEAVRNYDFKSGRYDIYARWPESK